MEETYVIFRGIDPHGSMVSVAIHEDELSDSEAGDYFAPGTVDIEEAGRLEIGGDNHLLPAYFTFE